MKPPICPNHNVEMYLLKGCHRESGGFVDNYWYCGYTDYFLLRKDVYDERRCPYTTPARNREEAECESEWQIRASDPAYVEALKEDWKKLDAKYPKPQPKELRKEPVTENEMKNICYLDLDKIRKANENPCFITESTVFPPSANYDITSTTANLPFQI